MTYVMEPGGRAAEPAPSPELEADIGPSVMDAVQRDLGFALKKKKSEVDVLVVDSASKVPIEN